MTGRYPMRYGLQTAVIPQGHVYGLAIDEWLLPQALKAVGYETANGILAMRTNSSGPVSVASTISTVR